MKNNPARILFIPHGGGPLPLLNEPGHTRMVEFLQQVTPSLGTPSAVLVISAHWEEDIVTITGGESPPLIYDYYGFPDETYSIHYPVKGAHKLASKIQNVFQTNGIMSGLDEQRGFDHGLFVPLKIMYPDASIPCVQLSLVKNLDPAIHINIGKALAKLKNENILVLGSGFSFHNLKAFFKKNKNDNNEAFESWLVDTCTNKNISQVERESRLIKWSEAPFARYCHPREEHLLPLHVCAGMASSAAELVFHDNIMGIKTSAFMW